MEELIPIFRVADATASALWYERLGFVVTSTHRFTPELPIYMFLQRNGVELHLSEHTGDATANTLVYYWVDDVDSIAVEFGASISEQPWGREVQLTDPDGNRLRIATRRAEN